MTPGWLSVGPRVIVLLIAAAALGGCGLGTSRRSAPPRPSTEKDWRPPLSLTAEELARDYMKGRPEADRKYKGRRLDLEGDVDRVTTDSIGQRHLVLTGHTDGKGALARVMEVGCLMTPAQKDRALDLTRGQKVKVRGRCEGEGTRIGIELTDCELLEVGPDPAVKVTAEELAREYGADPKAADKKYTGKQLVVEGVVVVVRDKELVKPLAVLEGPPPKEGARPLRVRADSAPDQKNAFAKLARGQRVRVKGECTGIGRTDHEVVIAFAVLLPN